MDLYESGEMYLETILRLKKSGDIKLFEVEEKRASCSSLSLLFSSLTATLTMVRGTGLAPRSQCKGAYGLGLTSVSHG